MNEMDDNPWDWVWARLTGQDDPANSSEAPAWDAAQNTNLSHKFALGGKPVGYPASKAAANANPNGIATGAAAKYGADKYGITDAAGRRLAPLF